MAWEFEDQEKEKIQALQRQWKNIDGLNVQGQKNCVKFSYIAGYNSANEKAMKPIQEWLKINNVDPHEARQIKTIEDFVKHVNALLLIAEFAADPEPLSHEVS